MYHEYSNGRQEAPVEPRIVRTNIEITVHEPKFMQTVRYAHWKFISHYDSCVSKMDAEIYFSSPCPYGPYADSPDIDKNYWT